MCGRRWALLFFSKCSLWGSAGRHAIGHFLFNLYFNDIVGIDTQAQFIIDADDTSLFFSGEDADTLNIPGKLYTEQILCMV